MEEPKVLYLQTNSSHPAGKRYLNLSKLSDNDIEYIRKDVFIEKAVDWLKENITNNPNCDKVISRKGVVIMGELIKDFKKAMKL